MDKFKSLIIKERNEFITKIADERNGYRLEWFMCNNKLQGQNFYRGKILCGFNRKVEACFLTLDELNLTDSLLNCCEISRRVSIQNVIKVKGICLNVSDDTIFVAYQAFDDTYSSWAIIHSADMTIEWWKEQIRAMLESMFEMMIKGVFHNGLNKAENYFIRSMKLCLSHVANDLPIGKVEKSDVLKTSLTSLKEFIVSQAKETCENDPDWSSFEDSFDDCTIDQVRQHPFLLTSIERFKYYRGSSHYEAHYMSEKERETLKVKLIERGAEHIHWQATIDANPGGIFWRVLHYKNLQTEETSYELLKFIGKLMDHYYERAAKNPSIIGAANRRVFEEEISTTFPGFLSLVHNILVFIYRDRPDYIDALGLYTNTLSLEMRKDANRFDTAWRITSYHSDLLTSYRRKLAYTPSRT